MIPGVAKNFSPSALKSRAINALILPYYAIRNTWPIWFSILNKEGREKFDQEKRELNEVQRRIVSDLNKNGVAKTTLQELFSHNNHLPTLLAAATQLRTSAMPHKKKSFLEQLFETFPLLDLKNPFISLALEDTVLDIINGYMRMWCKFEYINLNVTIPVPTSVPPQISQCWHRDPGDKKIIKMFVYLNDVDETSGPFIYARGSNYHGKWRNIFRQRLPHGYYPPEGAVEKRIPSTDIQTCVGPAGTVVFADTTGLHKGGYATAKERIMFTAGFTTKASPRGIYYRHPENMETLLQTLPPRTAYAVTGKKFGEGGGY